MIVKLFDCLLTNAPEQCINALSVFNEISLKRTVGGGVNIDSIYYYIPIAKVILFMCFIGSREIVEITLDSLTSAREGDNAFV